MDPGLCTQTVSGVRPEPTPRCLLLSLSKPNTRAAGPLATGTRQTVYSLWTEPPKGPSSLWGGSRPAQEGAPCHSPDSRAGPGCQTWLRPDPGWEGLQPLVNDSQPWAAGTQGGWLGQMAPKGSEGEPRTSLPLTLVTPLTPQLGAVTTECLPHRVPEGGLGPVPVAR